MKRVATQKVKEAVLNPLERRSPVEDTIKQATDEALYAAIKCRRNVAANELIRRYKVTQELLENKKKECERQAITLREYHSRGF